MDTRQSGSRTFKVIGHVDAIAVAAQMVYTMIGLVGSMPKPPSRARIQYPNVPEPVPDNKSFTRKPLQTFQGYNASAENTLNKALSELHYKILPDSATTERSEETVIALYAMAAVDRALDEVHMAKWDALNRPHCPIHNEQDDTPEGDESASIQGALSTVASECTMDWSMVEGSLGRVDGWTGGWHGILGDDSLGHRC